MSDTALTTELVYYAANSAALFPIPAGSKAPAGIVGSFKHDHSSDPAQWNAWRAEHPNCNFGVVAFASQWIVCDPDADKVGREAAWQAWCALCAEWGLPAPAMPHVQSARGGWHIYFQVPPHIDASTLRQPDALKGIINVRCVGYVVAAGSYYEENGVQLPYILMSSQPPHPCPDALLAHCTRAERVIAPTPPGSRDMGDVAAVLQWLNERDVFAPYEDWLAAGMAIKLEYGDAGADLWSLTHDHTVTPDIAASKWASFATEPTAQSVTLASFLDRAHKLGWRGSVRKSTASMFDGVAQIAAAAGASLSSSLPLPPGPAALGMPMMAGQELLATLAAPILTEFLAATTDAPAAPVSDNYPTLPAGLSSHGLYPDMLACITRIMAMAEPPAKVKPTRWIDPLAVLNVLHSDVFDALCRRLTALGHTLPDRRIKLAAANLSEKVERITVTHDKWEYDRNGVPENDNSDNVQVLLGILGLEVRWNAWLERMEIRGGIDADVRWPEWTYIDDATVAKLRTRANRTKTRFRPGKDFIWESLLTLAHANLVDPVLETLASLRWDNKPRLLTWLSVVCGVPCDVYHQAVGRSIIGGMVVRARYPGIKFDTMPVFFGPQGTGKSTMIEILALKKEWFTDSILLGDASKELVLSLAGKLVVEIGEMGMRSNTNASHVKAMISRTTDAGRTAYARSVTERPRRNIFCGSTNDENPLQDPTGNRRFLPVRVSQEINLTWLRANIEQLVAEAAALESNGADFSIPRDVWEIAKQHQEAAREVSDMEARLTDWFGETTYTANAFVTTTDLAELCDLAGWKNIHTLRNSIMKRLGFREVQPYINAAKTRGWMRGPEMLPKHIERLCVRYKVGRTQDGRPRVAISSAPAT